ncbi:hypothetical protein ZWY2020_001353 [Hordeum vulgare]|nr:hypothetical protein ZWY2020_001353 [Hordeum vulgare]
MFLCRRGASDYRGVCVRPSGTFYTKIHSGVMRLGLGTFDTANKAARAYNATTWRLNRPCRDMHFHEVMTRELVLRLAPPPRVVTEEDRRQNRRRECHLGINEMDEHTMATRRQKFPHNVFDERAFFVQRRTERATYRENMRTRKQAALFNMKLKGASTWESGGERWADAFITTKKSDTSASEEDDEE